MSRKEPSEPREVQYADVDQRYGMPTDMLSLDDISRVRLTLTANIGKKNMTVRDVLELRKGSVVQLDKVAGEMTDISINNVSLARGEVVVIGDNLHIRIGEIFGISIEKSEGISE